MAPADGDADGILVFTPIGRDGPASAELLGRIGLRVSLCADFQDLIAKAEAGAAALFIAEEGLFGKDLSPLRALVKNQPPWSDLPLVILTSRQDNPAIVAWRQRLTGLLGNVSLLERPLQAISLTSTMQAALRARQRQYEVRTLLDARERAAQELETLVVARTQALQDANRELRAQMAERARVEEALRQAQKIEAVGQLTGGVAHDFNNLLMVIIGGLDMLERNPNELRRQQIVDGMRKAALRGASLTRQLLAFSRRQPLHPEVVDLRRLVGSMRDLLDRSLRTCMSSLISQTSFGRLRSIPANLNLLY
jgi:signal transduction histidine kinase